MRQDKCWRPGHLLFSSGSFGRHLHFGKKCARGILHIDDDGRASPSRTFWAANTQVKVNFRPQPVWVRSPVAAPALAVKELLWFLEASAREIFLKELKVFGLKVGPGGGGGVPGAGGR